MPSASPAASTTARNPPAMSRRRILAVITRGRFGDVHRHVNCAAAADTSHAMAMPTGRAAGRMAATLERHGADQQPEPHRAMDQPFAGQSPAEEPDRFVLLDLEHSRGHQDDPEDEDHPDDRREGDERTDQRTHAAPSLGSPRRKTSTIRQKRAGCSR